MSIASKPVQIEQCSRLGKYDLCDAKKGGFQRFIACGNNHYHKLLTIKKALTRVPERSCEARALNLSIQCRNIQIIEGDCPDVHPRLRLI